MDLSLERIRLQHALKLDNQRQAATVLAAVEENLAETSDDRSPAAYFVLFLLLVDSAGDVAAAATYLANVVVEHVPAPLLRQHFAQVLGAIGGAMTAAGAPAPVLRAACGVLGHVLAAQDLQGWNATHRAVTPARGLEALLELSTDPRPKVRKAGVEAVAYVMAHPPAGPSLEHPGARAAAAYTLHNIEKGLGDKNTALTVHALQLAGAVCAAGAWPGRDLVALCDGLLAVARTLDQYMVQAALAVFEHLFAAGGVDAERFRKLLAVVLDLRPAINDAHLAAPWFAVVAKAMAGYARVDPVDAVKRVPRVFKLLLFYCAADLEDIASLATQGMIAVAEAFSDDMLVSAEAYETVDDSISEVATTLSSLLTGVRYTHCVEHSIGVVTALLARLRTRANPDLLPLVDTIGTWRSDETSAFAHRAAADACLAAAIAAVGPEPVLSSLPLNLIKPLPTRPGRAWMVPLLRDNVHHTPLAFFQHTIAPTIRALEDQDLEPESVHAKIVATLVDQLWHVLVGCCTGTTDVPVSVTDQFLSLISGLLYENVALRPVLCQALRMLVELQVESEDVLVAREHPAAAVAAARAHLATKASNMLSVLFNVYSQTPPESRGFISDAIKAFLTVLPPEDLADAFNKVCALLRTALDDDDTKAPIRLALTMMDLVVQMAPFLPESLHDPLLLVLAAVAPANDPLLQKRAFRIISKLGESPAGRALLERYLPNIQQVLAAAPESVDSARVARLRALQTVVALLPDPSLVFIPQTLPVVVFSINDTNAKTREAAFETLVTMAERMAAGGVVNTAELGDEGEPVAASLREFVVMVVAGLTGESVARKRTITALGLVVYKFRDQIDHDLLTEVCTTVEDYCLLAPGRDIAKAAVGFVKNEVVALPEEVLRPRLGQLLPKLLQALNTHQRAFNAKIKHIIERMIRRFGFEAVEAAMPAEDSKLLVNIRKSRERAGRKEKAEGGKERGNGYDDVLLDSEEEEEEEERPKAGGKGKQFIVELENPLDLLDQSALAHISSSAPRKTKKGLRAAAFPTKNGKLVIDAEEALPEEGVSAYVEAVQQGPVRGQKNRLKWKQSRGDDEDERERERPKARKVSKPRGKRRN